MEQSYFAENIFRVFGVPSAMVLTEGVQRQGKGHTWIGFLVEEERGKRAWEMDVGRIRIDVTSHGIIKDPTDPDGYLEESDLLVLASLTNGEDPVARIEKSHDHLDIARWIDEKLRTEALLDAEIVHELRLNRKMFLVEALRCEKFNPAIWDFITATASRGEFDEKELFFWCVQAVNSILDEQPEFTLRVLDELAVIMRSRIARSSIFTKAARSLERDRPDLVNWMKVIEGRGQIAHGEYSDGLESLSRSILDMADESVINVTVIRKAMDALKDLEYSMADKKRLIEPYTILADKLVKCESRHRTLVWTRKEMAKKLCELHRVFGEESRAKKYEAISGLQEP